MSSLEKKNLALEKELLSAKTYFNNTLLKLKEAEKRCSELQTSVQRFVVAGLFLKNLRFVFNKCIYFFFELFTVSRRNSLAWRTRTMS